MRMGLAVCLLWLSGCSPGCVPTPDAEEPQAPARVAVDPEPQPPVETSRTSEPTAKEDPAEQPEVKEPPRFMPVPVWEDDPNRWLVALEAADDSPGGWATGTFNAARNRLIIYTWNVTRFSVDTSRIPINWDRLVVLRLNEDNSELRRRDAQILHFRLDPRAGWQIEEE
jgi:hypothetical protein